VRIGIDLDGTIITCKEKHCILMQVIAKSYGQKFCAKHYWYSKRSGLNNIKALVRQNISLKIAEKINKTWISNVENIEWAYFDTLFPDALSNITMMKERGDSLHLVSARNNVANAEYQLEILGIDKVFNTINFVSSTSGLSKSHYLTRLALDVYIGDTELDYREALKSNTMFFPTTDGMRSRDFFKSLGINSPLNQPLKNFLEKEKT